MATTLDEARTLVSTLPHQDRARLLAWMAEDLADHLPGIESDPRVCGGSARVAGTRIPVWSLEAWRRQGSSDEELLRNFPSLRATDLKNAWRHVDRHPQEIEGELEENSNLG